MFTINDLCLLCLKNNANLKSILSKDRDGVIVKEKLKCVLSTHIKIELEDYMLYICVRCLEILNNVYNYKRLCVWNINWFNSYIHKLKSADETNTNLQVTLIDINNININIVACGNKLNSESITTINSKIDNVTVHKDQNENETKQRQKPEVVGDKLKKESNEMRYINNVSHNIKNNKAPKENVFEEEENFDSETKYEFLDEIVKEETKDNYDIIDEQSDLYNNEIVKEETEDNYNIIDEKSELYNDDNNEEPKSTIYPRNADKKYNCNECHKSFKFRTHLITHNRRIHNGGKPFACDLCDKAFNNQSYLVRHEVTHNGTKPHKCDVCDKAFSLKGNLVSHKRIHSEEIKCDVCNKIFSRRDRLVKHKFCHTGEKPYKCDECHKAFNNRSNLVKHRRIHTVEKPFKCDLCDKAFIVKCILIKHKRIHTGERPFKCDYVTKHSR